MTRYDKSLCSHSHLAKTINIIGVRIASLNAVALGALQGGPKRHKIVEKILQ